MAVIAMPTVPAAPKSIEWNVVNAVAAAQSPFSLQKQVADWGGATLQASLSYAPMNPQEAAPWEAFLMALRGGVNTFLFGDPLREAPQNPSANAGVVSAAGQTGFTLATTSSGLKPGDWIQVGQRLYRVTAASGGTLGIWPNLRESPAGGTPLVIAAPKGLFRLAGAGQGYQVDTMKQYHFVFEIEEAL